MRASEINTNNEPPIVSMDKLSAKNRPKREIAEASIKLIYRFQSEMDHAVSLIRTELDYNPAMAFALVSERLIPLIPD